MNPTHSLDLTALEVLQQKLGSIKNLDARPLMLTWQNIILEDNRRGVLSGLDKDGVPMVPVTYRPKEAPGLRVSSSPKGKGSKRIKETLKQFRRGQRTSLKQGAIGGIGQHEAGINNNLSTAEYQLLGGPPLAPRDQFSRVITNLTPQELRVPSSGQPWECVCAWDEVVSTRGVAFLRYHFEGTGKLPRRDLRGVRPQGVEKALDALRNWARTVIHEHFST